MGNDINFYPVKQISDESSLYQLWPPVLRGQVTTGARAQFWEDLMLFRHAPEHQIAGLDLSWLTYHQDVPEEFDEYMLEQTFDGSGVVFDAELILQDVLRVKQRMETQEQVLPSHFWFHVHHHGLIQPFHGRSAFWMLREDELWSFQAGWNLCEGYPTSIKAHLPGSAEHQMGLFCETFPDVSRTLHGWDFPDDGLEGFVLGHEAHPLGALAVLEDARMRQSEGREPDRVTIIKNTYAEFYKDQLNGLMDVCEFAFQNGCAVLVEHNY